LEFALYPETPTQSLATFEQQTIAGGFDAGMGKPVGILRIIFCLGDKNLRCKIGNIHLNRVWLKNVHAMKHLDVHIDGSVHNRWWIGLASLLFTVRW
jgi:hypothetical protein